MDNDIYLEANKIEADARSLLDQGESEKAFDLFDTAGRLYRVCILMSFLNRAA
jgi:hypothetical protein